MMAQYRRIRGQLPPNTILLFRLGDFYEMFFEDAQEAARILEITLTRRQGVPMCGVPYHAVDQHVAKLIRAGRKVAVCDQMEDPATAKGIVRREVTSIVTPGTATQDTILVSALPNYLCAVCREGGRNGLAMLDISTGDFWAEEFEGEKNLADLLRRYGPRECLLPESLAAGGGSAESLRPPGGPTVTTCDDWVFAYDVARDRLVRHFRVHSLDGFGCEGRRALVGAAGALLHYVQETLRRDVGHLRRLRIRNPADYLVLDEATCQNLDLVRVRGGERSGEATTLLGVLDATRTAMGARALRDWILRPLMSPAAIAERQDALETFTRERRLLADLRQALGEIRDLERLVARLTVGGNARDARAIGDSLGRLPQVQALAAGQPCALLQALAAQIVALPELVGLLERALLDEPAAGVKEGGMIRPGFNRELDELRSAATEGRQWLVDYQGREQARTGIKTLKVRHNKVFGYYLEVSRGQAEKVPAEYLRKQTLVTGERFTTPELKDYETRILGAQDRAMALEFELWQQLRAAALQETERIQNSAHAVAQLDTLAALADRALALRYTRPVVTDEDSIAIREGRHPVLEQLPDTERFVPNDARLDGTENQLLILTGPNMAGKSTYIRQVGMIVVMAQMGSFVPAAEARIGVVDRIFTRVGASDDITRGRSTFMVEMQETANILNNATRRSLIILDEIGRGTSTFDGISIAWAVAEYLHNRPETKAKTLFATHYHELTDLALAMPGVKNYNVLVSERGDHVVFLRRIVPGGADKSYGIQVARLAGLPAEVIDRAKEILANLEEGELSEAGQPKLARQRSRRMRDIASGQLNLFGS
jgi:DNA mismatch repair protein MutS